MNFQILIDFMQQVAHNKRQWIACFAGGFLMDRIEKEENIIGYITLLSNKLAQFGDNILPDITFKQWFLLIMISKMEIREKSLNSIAAFVGTSRQNIKKMLIPLENKGYVRVLKSELDARALKVELTEKSYRYFNDNADITAQETNKLFGIFSIDEINSFIANLEKLAYSLSQYSERNL